MDNNASLPAPLKVAQASIRSFFKPKAPSYATAPAPSGSSKDKDSPPKEGITVVATEVPESTASPSDAKSPIAPPPKSTSPTPPPAHAVSVSPAPKSVIPKQATISKILPSHIAALKRINALLLCITYPDNFYHAVLQSTPHPNFSRAILWATSPTTPMVIGGIVCRLEPSPTTATSELYIQSLALLSPYRAYGLATAALDDVINTVVKNPLAENPITSLYAHVWTENEDGLEWYKKRGFTVEGSVVEGYYRRLKPDTALVLRRTLAPSDHIRNAASAGPATNAAANGPPVQGPPPPKTAGSFQTTRPESEWNDLPTDILLPSRAGTPSIPKASSGLNSAVDSAASSRSSSAAPKRKKREYPAAAFAPGSGSAGSGSQA